MSLDRRCECLIFAAAFFAFAWFHQGGGWNQNSRFAEVRAVVEEGRFAIDNFLVYEKTAAKKLRRIPIENGWVVIGGDSKRLAWNGGSGNELVPIERASPAAAGSPTEALASLDEVAASGDVSFANGHFHPNKPPGASLFALPAYFAIHHIERRLGYDPDDWWMLALNAWLTSAFSAGLISAIGCVLFFREASAVAEASSGERAAGASSTVALLATVALAFGTLYWPFATVLFDHNFVAVTLFGAFSLARRSKRNGAPARSFAFCSGMCAGLAALTNYVAAGAVIFLGIYWLIAARRKSAAWYALGVSPIFLISCAYHQACYGSPLACANDFQNPMFRGEHELLGMFALPNPLIGISLLVSPFRGLFYSSPVLLAAVWGWWPLRKSHRPEAWLMAAMFGLFFFVNAAFSGWHGGYSCGPRYLIPTLPFLALGLVPAILRFREIALALIAISVSIQLLFTAVDAQSPLGVGSLARSGTRHPWFYNQLTEYFGPLFFTGRAWPMLRRQIDERLGTQQAELIAARRAGMETAIEAGNESPLTLGGFQGPVSVNTMGIYEGRHFMKYDAHSEQARWNSFNAGEFFLPNSRWSLLPLLLLSGGLLAAAFRVHE